MDTVGAYEAKTHLSKLLDRVSKGECITITRHGLPVAVLQPPEGWRDRQKVAEAIARIEKFSKDNTLGPDLTIRDLIEQGRR